MKTNLLLLTIWLISGVALAREIHCDSGGNYLGLDITDTGQAYNVRVKNLDNNPLAKQMGLPGAESPNQYSDFEVSIPKSECLVSGSDPFLAYCSGGTNSVRFYWPDATRAVHAVRVEVSRRYVETINRGTGSYYDLMFLVEDDTYPFFVRRVDYSFGSGSCRTN